MWRLSTRPTSEKSDQWLDGMYARRCESGVVSDYSGAGPRSVIVMLSIMVIHVRAKPEDICAPACSPH